MIRADVSRPEELARLVAEANGTFGALDVFVHNALGNLLNFLSPPFSTTLEQFDEAFHAQARAFYIGMREAAGRLRDGGRVIAVSYWPGSHLGGFQPYFAMGTNKAAIEAMCRYYAVALASRGITVNAVDDRGRRWRVADEPRSPALLPANLKKQQPEADCRGNRLGARSSIELFIQQLQMRLHGTRRDPEARRDLLVP